MKQQQMTVGRKLTIVSGGLVGALMLVGVFSIYNLANLNKTTQLIITDPLPERSKWAWRRWRQWPCGATLWRHMPIRTRP